MPARVFPSPPASLSFNLHHCTNVTMEAYNFHNYLVTVTIYLNFSTMASQTTKQGLSDTTTIQQDVNVPHMQVPLWWPDSIPDDLNAQKQLATEILKKHPNDLDWVNDDLMNEISQLLPTPQEIDNSSGKRDSNAYTTKVSKFLHVGRIFHSYKQFVVASQYLLKAWAIFAPHGAKCIRCSFGEPFKKSTKEIPNPSIKDLKCPFHVIT